MVNRSTTDEQTWGTAFQVGDNIGPDDICAIIAYGGNAVGVLMSEHRVTDTESGIPLLRASLTPTRTTDWAAGPIHLWRRPLRRGSHQHEAHGHERRAHPRRAEDERWSEPHPALLARSNGTWTGHAVVGSRPGVSRPQVVVDETNEMAYVLYTSPELTEQRRPGRSTTSPRRLSTLAFNSAGLGTTFIGDAGQDINNVSTAKHGVTSASGLLAIASADTNISYYHGFLSLGGSPGPSVHRHRGHAVRGRHRLAVGTGHHDRLHGHEVLPQGSRSRAARWPRSWLARSICRRRRVTTSPTTMATAHEDNINRLFEAGITTGCTATKFCPKDPVTRGQMSTFLDRGLRSAGREP